MCPNLIVGCLLTVGAEYSMLPCPLPPPDVSSHDDDEGVDAGLGGNSEVSSLDHEGNKLLLLIT